jgi:hypothetical protein
MQQVDPEGRRRCKKVTVTTTPTGVDVSANEFERKLLESKNLNV